MEEKGKPAGESGGDATGRADAPAALPVPPAMVAAPPAAIEPVPPAIVAAPPVMEPVPPARVEPPPLVIEPVPPAIVEAPPVMEPVRPAIVEAPPPVSKPVSPAMVVAPPPADVPVLPAVVPVLPAVVPVPPASVADSPPADVPALPPIVAAPAPVIASVEPSRGPRSGRPITIRGSGFLEKCAVHVGGCEIAAVLQGSDALFVTAPPQPLSGPADVKVVNPDGQFALLVHGFHYDSPPEITSVRPRVVSAIEGGTVSVVGAHFEEGCVARTGADALVTRWIDAECVQVTLPAHPAGSVGIEVKNPDGQVAAFAGALTFEEGPVITRVSPAEGPLSGGTEVVLSGRGFSADCLVTFFDEHAPIVAIDGEGRLRFVTPPHERAGAGAIRVVTPEGLSYSLPSAFTYVELPPPAVRGVAADHGYHEGGKHVMLAGSGFQEGCRVFFGASEARAAFKGTDTLEVTVPRSESPGRVDIRVENPDGQSSTLAQAFDYRLPPAPAKLTSVAPKEGYCAGGLALTLYGDNFDESTAVRVGDVMAEVKVMSRVRLEVTTPARAAEGPVAIEIVNREGVTVRFDDAFLYVTRPAPEIHGVAPASGPTTGGTKVVIEGVNFAADNVVRVGREAPQSVRVRSATQIEIVTAARRAPGIVDVEVVMPGAPPAVAPSAFRYDAQPPPTIESVAPSRGGVGGGTEIAITGKSFVAGVTVLIDGKPAKPVKFVDARNIEAKTPAGRSGQMVDVTVVNPDGKQAVARRAFLYDPRYS